MKRTRPNLLDDGNQESTPEWLLTYSDLVTLTLTFFVMLFSMSTIDKARFEEIATSFRSAFSGTGDGILFFINRGKDVVKIRNTNAVVEVGEKSVDNESDMAPALEFQEDTGGQEADIGEGTGGQETDSEMEALKGNMERKIEELGLGNFVDVVENEQVFTLRFNSVILFEAGKADIKPSGRETLKNLGALLKEVDKEIVVEGHTCNLPINTPQFPSNWELSTRRATNVVRSLIEECGLDPRMLTAAGKGEFEPIASNDTEEGRKQNRRIDIMIEK